ncbi:MAG: TylF/MycF family methyltransferase, partial [Armatimonadetes bacterium]|nr:TylF/MycF family methyltransferase [Armatimonadota bacterium]
SYLPRVRLQPSHAANQLQMFSLFFKSWLYRPPLVRYTSHYPYQYTPNQLGFLIQCLDRTSHLPGPVLEVGCFRGATTVWLNRHMDEKGYKNSYIALDTFSGFTSHDLRHEIDHRGKPEELKKSFSHNHQSWFNEVMRENNCSRVQSVRTDASTFDYPEDISFALIDMDLYLPVQNVLSLIYERLSYEGIIIVDDCQSHPMFDGALQAYQEFVTERGLKSDISHGKLGVIEKPCGFCSLLDEHPQQVYPQ